MPAPKRRNELKKQSPPSPRADRKSARATQIDVAALRKFGQRLFANIVARERGYALRKYQINAAIEAVSLASVGKNSAIELPTGTGKTLIACLAATYWKRLQPHARVLLVVPSRTLVVQHFDVAHWIMPELVVDSLDDDQSGKPGSLRATLLRADFLITTPGILAGALERKLVDRSYVASIQFVIADEFDTFVVSDEADRYTESRFAQNWSRLKAQLTPKTRFLVKSATLNLTQDGSMRGRAHRHAQEITRALSPIGIRVSESEYASVVPLQKVQQIGRLDLRVADLVAAVSRSKGALHAKLDDLAGPTDYDNVERTAAQVCEGDLPPRYRGKAPSDQARIRALYCGITALKMMPQHIFEDLTHGLEVSIQNARIKTSDNEIVFVRDARLLDDRRISATENGRRTKRFEFSAGLKFEVLKSLLKQNGQANLRTVVFCRTVRLLDALRAKLAPLKTHVLKGELGDFEKALSLMEFRQSEHGVLLMTRTMGGRGLDLPFAHSAIFYSPKTDSVQMWQEMSRIRSTVSRPKITFVLCYDQTLEPEILKSVVAELEARDLKITLATT